jgi:hypothetical protein
MKNSQQMKWPLKAILRAPKLWWKGIVIERHLKKAYQNQIRANKHNKIACVMLNLISSVDAELPDDDHLWLGFVNVPGAPRADKNAPIATVQEWHFWGDLNSPEMNNTLSKLPGRLMWIKNLNQIRSEVFMSMAQPAVPNVPVAPGDTKWIQ